ncbi:MAG TPA: hypothetical protein ENN03_00220 [bacterium]|nr:hypothetical protein [bacterium]
MNIRTVRYEEILQDFFFRFSSPSDLTDLKASIAAGGFETPLQVIASGKRYRIIAGFRRYEAARSLSLSNIPVRVWEPDSPVELFYRVLLAQRAQRSFTLIEKARVLLILDRLGEARGKARKRFLSILDLPFQEEILESIRAAAGLEQPVQEYIERLNLSLKMAQPLLGLDSRDQITLIQLADLLRIRGVELAEMVESIRDILGRKCLSLSRLLGTEPFKQIIHHRDWTPSQKRRRIHLALEERRNPGLRQVNEEIRRHCDQLGIPLFGNITWDQTLERPGVELRMRIHSSEEVDRAAGWLSDESLRSIWKHLLDSMS